MSGLGHVVRVVCRAPWVAGFQLSGIEVTAVEEPSRTLEALRRHGADAKTAIILVDEALLRALPSEARHRLERQTKPMVAPFPSPAWSVGAAAEEAVLEILRQAIGYRVRPR